jgi:hypothetical protein
MRYTKGLALLASGRAIGRDRHRPGPHRALIYRTATQCRRAGHRHDRPNWELVMKRASAINRGGCDRHAAIIVRVSWVFRRWWLWRRDQHPERRHVGHGELRRRRHRQHLCDGLLSEVTEVQRGEMPPSSRS